MIPGVQVISIGFAIDEEESELPTPSNHHRHTVQLSLWFVVSDIKNLSNLRVLSRTARIRLCNFTRKYVDRFQSPLQHADLLGFMLAQSLLCC
jgi:hypothetical protein